MWEMISQVIQDKKKNKKKTPPGTSVSKTDRVQQDKWNSGALVRPDECAQAWSKEQRGERV